MAHRFEIWLQSAQPGSEFIYHTGPYLSKDGKGLDFTTTTYFAREAFDRGEIILVQRRLSHGKTVKHIGKFAWVAIKRETLSPPEPVYSREGDLIEWVKRPEKRRKAAS